MKSDEVSVGKISKLSFKTKFSYGIGDLASNISWGLVSSYLLIFYTDVYGLSAAVAGTLILIARVWDIFIDPIVGLFVERRDSKFGRFRPYILIGAVLTAIFNTLTFVTPSFSDTAKIAYACITYIILGTVYSVVSISYGALATVMTNDTNERTSLNSFRGFFASISNVIVGASVMPLVSILGNGNNQIGYALTALVLSLISIPLYLMVIKNCKEVIQPPKSQYPSIKESVMAVATNKPLLMAMIFLLLMFTALFGRLGIVVFYYIYVLGRPDLIALLMMGFGIFTALGAILVSFLANHMEKKTLLIVSCGISAVGLIAMYFTPSANVMMITILTLVYSISVGFCSPMIFSIIGDCIDDNECKTGKRADGAIYSMTSLITKVSSAIIGGLTAFSLASIGYVPNAQQSASAINGINIVVNVIPAVLYIAAMLPLFLYGISKARAMENSKELERRRNNILNV